MPLKQRLRAGLTAFMHPQRPQRPPPDREPAHVVIDQLLSGRNVLVTGAGRNIGKSIALEMAAHGANVYCTEIDPALCESLEAELARFPVSSRVFRSDITAAGDSESVCASLVSEGADIDVLVNNVGSGGSDLRRVFELNVVAPMHLTTLVHQGMVARKKPGSIIFLTSIHQETVFRWSIPYSASKGALGMLIKELAVELAPHGIRVNGIAPGWVAEDDQKRPLPHGWAPLGGSSVNPSYIGRAAVYLASDYFSRHTTGAVITIDGGLSLFNYVCAAEVGLRL